MKTIGEVLKEARITKKYSLDDLSEETKIKKEFLRLIEANRWEKLPTMTVVSGFVKNMAFCLDLPREKVMAMYRRDYPPKVGMINPKPDVEKKVGWSPRLTFFLGVGVVVLMVAGYLGFQYYKFSRPPKLTVEFPTVGEVVKEEVLRVIGKTDIEATVVVNNQPVYLDEDGGFNEEIEVNGETKTVRVRAISRAGRETVVEIPIQVEIK